MAKWNLLLIAMIVSWGSAPAMAGKLDRVRRQASRPPAPAKPTDQRRDSSREEERPTTSSRRARKSNHKPKSSAAPRAKPKRKQPTPAKTHSKPSATRGKLDRVSRAVRADRPSSPATDSHDHHDRSDHRHHNRHRRACDPPRRSHWHLHADAWPTMLAPAPPQIVQHHNVYVVEDSFYPAEPNPAVVAPALPPLPPDWNPDGPVSMSPGVEAPAFDLPELAPDATDVTPVPMTILPPQLGDGFVRFELDYTTDVDDVPRLGFHLLANASAGLGIDTTVQLFRERSIGFRDSMWTGDFNIVYELSPTPWLRPRAGIGLNWLHDSIGSEAGFNMTVGADVLAGPITLTGELDFGTLGDADLSHARLTAGFRTGEHAEWYAGYDWLDIGGVEFRGVVAGLRFRF